MQTIYVSRNSYRLEFTGSLRSDWRKIMDNVETSLHTIKLVRIQPRVSQTAPTRRMVRQ
jgi:hypothetical protein